MNGAGWRWAALGKHPMARDFIRIGSDLPVLPVLSEWVERGYKALLYQKPTRTPGCSWRFWSRGARRNQLLFGLLKDSSDAVGRPYPLLIVGQGPLHDWEKGWDLLGLALDGAWNRIEYLSRRQFGRLEDLETELNRVTAPQSDWNGLREAYPAVFELARNMDRRWFDSGAPDQEWEDRASVFLRVRPAPGVDPLQLAGAYQVGYRKLFQQIPQSLFLGGTPASSCLVFYHRSLRPADFLRLWSV